MKNRYLSLIILCAVFFVSNSFAQQKIAILGSSTAFGDGASAYELSWVGRLESYYNQNTSDGLDTTFYNLAQGGYNSYLEMPTDYTPPAGRPGPDVEHNVTKALSYSPDIVIINLPSNDIAEGYSKNEYMDNLRLMNSTIIASGAKAYITTPQPRNDFTVEDRQLLLDLVDSVHMNFGLRSIDFWDTIVSKDGQNLIRDDVMASQFHVNDLGHLYLFQQVVERISAPEGGPLPVRLTDFQARLKDNSVVIKWHTELQDPNTTFELQKSKDGYTYQPFYTLYVKEGKQAADYATTDVQPLQGKSFYRLKISTAARQSYSNSVSILRTNPNLGITGIYKNATNVVAEIIVPNAQMVSINIISATGAIVFQQKQYVSNLSTKISLPVSNLASGQYYLSVRDEHGSKVVKAFNK